MGDIIRVEFDTRRAGERMRALTDTEGMPTPQRTLFWLEKLSEAAYRGRYDTWTAARDRAAKNAGVELSMAKRIWQRWADMKDVGGETVIKLMLAYNEMCRLNDEAAANSKAKRVELRDSNEINPEHAQPSVGIRAAQN
jgi:hypothetical protein